MGFISKWYLAQGSLAATGVNAALNVVGPVILLISALLTAGYLFPIVIRGFIVGNAGHGHDEPAPVYERNDAPWMMLIPLLLLAALSVVIGLFPNALIELLTKVGELLA
jgi:multicomponent Na+:H+ antiporter subunit D